MRKPKKIIVILLVIALVYFGFNLSKGPTIVIETPKHAEDFVVVCNWTKESFLRGGHGQGTYRSDYKVFVAESGEQVSCGWSIWGGRGSVSTMHPVLMGDGKENYIVDGARHIVYNKSKLEILDEQKAKFEASEQSPMSGLEYARSSSMLCGFPHQYLEYYSEVKKVDIEKFKKNYHKAILECKKRTFPLLNKYSPNSYPGKRPSPEESMNNLWNSKGWKKYE